VTKARLFLVGALGIALASCAAERASPEPSAEAPDISQAERDAAELQRAEAELAAVSAATAVDCERAAALTQSICRLADRICAIAARHPGDARSAALCSDGASRCDKARPRTQARCGSPTP
jgi:hypothetical protein